jgi:hypothetical protein
VHAPGYSDSPGFSGIKGESLSAYSELLPRVSVPKAVGIIGCVEYLRRLEPTLQTLRTGRLFVALLGVSLAVIVSVWVLVPDFADANMRAGTAALGVVFVGGCMSYLGQPSLSRYRLGLVVMNVAAVVSLAILLTNPI